MSTRDDDAIQPTSPRFSREAAQEAAGRTDQDAEHATGQQTGQAPATGETRKAPQPPVGGSAAQQAPAVPPTASTAADPHHDTSRFDATPVRQGTASSPYRSAPSEPAGYDLSHRTSPYVSSAPGYATAASAPYAGSAASAGSTAPAAQPGGPGQPPNNGYPTGSASDSSAPRRRKQRRGPGWGGVIAATLAAAVLASGGTQMLDGRTALNYVRARHVEAEGNGDYGRITRQQKFLSALLRSALSNQVLLNPSKLNGFINAFTSDTFVENIDTKSLVTLGRSLQNVDAGAVTFLTVPTDGTNDWGNEIPRTDEIKSLFQAIIDDDPLPGEEREDTTPSSTSSTTTAPTSSTPPAATPPTSWAIQYGTVSFHGRRPASAAPSVTAGLK